MGWAVAAPFLATTAHASFPTESLSVPATWASDVAVADLDGDGRLDLLSTSSGDDKVAVYRAQPDGSFAVQEVLATLPRAYSVAAAELDGDTLADVVAGGDGTVLSLSSSSGHAVATTVAAGTGTAVTLSVGDVDGDGDLDLAVGWNVRNEVCWYENLGASFGPEQLVYSLDAAPSSVELADLDDDGDADLVVSSHDVDRVVVVDRDGADWDAPRIVSASLDGAIDTATIDIDGDGVLDVVAAGAQADEVVWYRNLGSVFGLPTTLAAGIDYPTTVDARDVDGDGLADVLVGIRHEILLLRQSGASWSQVSVAPTDMVSAVGAEDVDGDGSVDVVFASSGDSRVAWVPRVASTFLAPLSVTSADGGAQDVAATDIDGDGDLDVVVAARGEDAVTTYENLGGTFGPQQRVDGDVAGAMAVVAIDVDGDGLDDLVSATEGGQLGHHPNLGGVYGPRTVLETLGGADQLLAGDLDLDGDLDLVVSGTTAHESAWLENLGGSFAAAVTLAWGSDAVALADLDLDGDTDLVTVSTYSDTVGWHENLGGGSFGAHQWLGSVDAPWAVATADLDGDSDMDILTGSSATDALHRFEHLADGTFAAMVVSGDYSTVIDIDTTDVDHDGDLDIVVAALHPDGVTWVENLAPGFGAWRTVGGSGWVEAIATVDLDSDGDADVLSAGSSTDSVLWHEVAGAPLVLRVPPLVGGSVLDMGLDGVSGSERAYLTTSADLGAACPPILDGVCLQLHDPRVLGELGPLTTVGPLPSGVARVVHMQGVQLGGGTSNVVSASLGEGVVLGAPDLTTAHSGAWIGNHVSAVSDETLLEVGFHGDVGSCDSVVFEVYELIGATWTSLYSESRAPVAGDGYHRSAPVSLPLVGGRAYLIGAGWDATCTVFVQTESTSSAGAVHGPVMFVGAAGSDDFPAVAPIPQPAWPQEAVHSVLITP